MGALLSAADRGVTVDIVINKMNLVKHKRYKDLLFPHKNINVFEYNTFEFSRLAYTNSLLHDKYMVIDDLFLVLGGRNIGDRFYDPEGFTDRVSLDKEVLVYSTDTIFEGSIAEVSRLFEETVNSRGASPYQGRNNRNWEGDKRYYLDLYDSYREEVSLGTYDYDENTIKINNITLLNNPVEPARKESVVACHLMKLARSSQKIIAESPYIAFTSRNLEIFSSMVKDKEFTILTNSLAASPNFPSYSNYYLQRRKLLKTNINIFEYQGVNSSLHGKVFLFDDRLTAIGSFNLNERSLRSDTESVLVIDSEEFCRITLEALKSKMELSLKVGEDNTYEQNDQVEVNEASLTKRILFNIGGRLVKPFRFLF